MFVEMCIVRRQFTAESTELVLLPGRYRDSWTLWCTYPLLQREMQGLFMTLPVVLCLERLDAKGALEW
jgi:hypothetical protein